MELTKSLCSHSTLRTWRYLGTVFYTYCRSWINEISDPGLTQSGGHKCTKTKFLTYIMYNVLVY